jgi:hypothetical protein
VDVARVVDAELEKIRRIGFPGYEMGSKIFSSIA